MWVKILCKIFNVVEVGKWYFEPEDTDLEIVHSKKKKKIEIVSNSSVRVQETQYAKQKENKQRIVHYFTVPVRGHHEQGNI